MTGLPLGLPADGGPLSQDRRHDRGKLARRSAPGPGPGASLRRAFPDRPEELSFRADDAALLTLIEGLPALLIAASKHARGADGVKHGAALERLDVGLLPQGAAVRMGRLRAPRPDVFGGVRSLLCRDRLVGLIWSLPAWILD